MEGANSLSDARTTQSLGADHLLQGSVVLPWSYGYVLGTLHRVSVEDNDLTFPYSTIAALTMR